MREITSDTVIEFVGDGEVIQGFPIGSYLCESGTLEIKVAWEDGHEGWITVDGEGNPVGKEFRVAA